MLSPLIMHGRCHNIAIILMYVWLMNKFVEFYISCNFWLAYFPGPLWCDSRKPVQSHVEFPFTTYPSPIVVEWPNPGVDWLPGDHLTPMNRKAGDWDKSGQVAGWIHWMTGYENFKCWSLVLTRSWSSLCLLMAWHCQVLGHQQTQCWLQSCTCCTFYV